MLTIADLVKVYPTGLSALNGVSLTVAEPQVVAVIGSSGAGKSTLIRCINRLVEPTSHQILSVVRHREWSCHGLSRPGPRPLGVRLEQHLLLGAEPGAVAHDLAGAPRVLGRCEEGMRTERPLARELQHHRTERGENHRRRPIELGTPPHRVLELVEILPHGGQRRGIGLAEERLDRGLMGDAEA